MMHENSMEKAAFSTYNGHYEFIRLPFGLSNAPSDFNRVITEIIRKITDFTENYFDNLTIHSKDIQKHFQQLNEVFQTIREAALKINYAKCTWLQQSLELFGHIIAKGTIKPHPKKIQAIVNWPILLNVKEVQRFFGMEQLIIIAIMLHILHQLQHHYINY